MKSKEFAADPDSFLDELLDKLTPEIQEKIDYRMNLAVKINNAIKRKGWTKTEFANAMGVVNSQVSRWLSGTHNFESDTLFSIQKKLDICLLDLNKKEEASQIFTIESESKMTVNLFNIHETLQFEDDSINEAVITTQGIQIIQTADASLN